jgi:hypothetical protein
VSEYIRTSITTTSAGFDRAANSRLAALLESKPPTDQVSLAAWWFVVSSLESSVQVRRVIQGVEWLSASSVANAVSTAQDATRAALEELPGWFGVLPRGGDNFGEAAPLLRSTIRSLALLVVTPRVTTARQLAEALASHSHALTLCLPLTAYRRALSV